MDKILLNETQKLSAVRKAPEFLDSGCDENDIYQVDKMSLEENKNKLEWRKRAFECKDKNSYGIEKQNYMIHIHGKEVNKIAECNLVYNIINPPKLAKNLNIHYSPILHGFMNTGLGRANFKNFQIKLKSVCSSTVVIGRPVEKLKLGKFAVMQWHT